MESNDLKNIKDNSSREYIKNKISFPKSLLTRVSTESIVLTSSKK